MTITEILCKEWQCELEELQLHVTLNPDVAKIENVMKEYANEAVSSYRKVIEQLKEKK